MSSERLGILPTLRRAFALMDDASRRNLVILIPVMTAASTSDVLTVMMASGLLETLTRPETAWLAGWARAFGASDATVVPTATALVVALVLVGNATILMSTHFVNRFGFGQSASMSLRVLGSIMSQPYVWFLGENSSRLKQQTLVETRRIASVVVVGAAQASSRAMGAVLIVAWLLSKDLWFGLTLGGVVAAFYLGYLLLIQRRMRALGATRSAEDKQRHKVLDESLHGVKELKLLGLEEVAVERLRGPAENYASAFAWTGTMTATAKPAIEVSAAAGLSAAVLYFWWSGRSHEAFVTLLGTYAVGAYRLLPTAQAIVRAAMGIQAESSSILELYNHVFASRRPQLEDRSLSFDREVTLEGLVFRYPTGDTDVLHAVDFKIRRGEWVALVGTTGSGKTTMVDVLMGLLEPGAGRVQVDGVELSDPSAVRAWQRHIGYVPQSLFMADATVAENIGFGIPELDPEQVRHVARVAQIASFIEDELPGAYGSVVGERGVRISGGQRQRVGIARALYRKPQLLVLDEATSALDNNTESAVMHSLREHLPDSTVLMIAHRLATTRFCDRIVLMEHGRVVAEGTYEELLATNDAFRELAMRE